MAATEETPVTRLIARAQDGDRAARERLFPHVEATLRHLAAARLRGRRGASLEATGLADQAFMDLLDQARHYADRGEFFRIASEHIRQLLVRHDRRRRPGKLTDEAAANLPAGDDSPSRHAERNETRLRLLAALRELEATDPDAAAVFRAVWFLDPDFSFAKSPAAILSRAHPNQRTFEQIGELMGTSRGSAFRLYALARAWLGRRLQGGE